MFKYGKSLLLGVWLALVAAPASALNVGDMAPDFSLPGSDGKVHRLPILFSFSHGTFVAKLVCPNHAHGRR